MEITKIDAALDRVLAGDIEAYEIIARAYQGDVWKVVAAMLFNTQKSEDLVQQTFISAFQHLDRYERGRDFGAWIKEIARNQVRQEIRRFQREDRRMEVYQAHLLESYDSSSGSAGRDRLEEALAECTKALPSSSSNLVELRYHSALNFGEIATRVGRTVEATRQQLARVRLALRECIESHLAKS